jgi:hypothetical protein
MSLSVIICPACKSQNINTAQFCGNCGASLVAAKSATPSQGGANIPGQTGPGPGQPGQPLVSNADANNQWHDKAGLICGALSIFVCGIIASIPGLYFSWSALNQAKAQGKSPTTAYIGLVLNVLGVLMTCAAIGLMIIMMLMAGAAGGGDMGQPDPFGY